MQTCNIHKYGNIFKYQYTQVKIYNMCDIYKTQKQRNYRNANSIKTPIPGNGAILLKAYSGKQQKIWKYFSGNYRVHRDRLLLNCHSTISRVLEFE